MRGAPGPLPTLDDVREAAGRLEGAANRTPVFSSRTLNELAGATIVLKCESFQRTGSFKFRGAYNAINRLAPEARRKGILTFSSGNHAQAVALAGRLHGASVVVVMPNTAPTVKRAATEGYGAEVVEYDETEVTREELAARIAEERGMTVIPPYDHPDIVAGQGTAALELLDEVGDLDVIFAPCGGGGLLSGTSLAATSAKKCRVVGVEPEMADDATRTFRSGEIQRVRNPATIADGLRTPSLGEWTWPIIRSHVSEMTTVTEKEIADAMRLVWSRMKLVIEPSGAVALAGALRSGESIAGQRVGVIVSGGNVDIAKAPLLMSEP